MTIKPMMDLSTAHMPSTSPNWGTLRAYDTEHGYVVFPLDFKDENNDVVNIPDWFKPINKTACEAGCLIVSFDSDADEDERFPTYEWETP